MKSIFISCVIAFIFGITTRAFANQCNGKFLMKFMNQQSCLYEGDYSSCLQMSLSGPSSSQPVNEAVLAGKFLDYLSKSLPPEKMKKFENVNKIIRDNQKLNERLFDEYFDQGPTARDTAQAIAKAKLKGTNLSPSERALWTSISEGSTDSVSLHNEKVLLKALETNFPNEYSKLQGHYRALQEIERTITQIYEDPSTSTETKRAAGDKLRQEKSATEKKIEQAIKANPDLKIVETLRSAGTMNSRSAAETIEGLRPEILNSKEKVTAREQLARLGQNLKSAKGAGLIATVDAIAQAKAQRLSVEDFKSCQKHFKISQEEIDFVVRRPSEKLDPVSGKLVSVTPLFFNGENGCENFRLAFPRDNVIEILNHFKGQVPTGLCEVMLQMARKDNELVETAETPKLGCESASVSAGLLKLNPAPTYTYNDGQYIYEMPYSLEDSYPDFRQMKAFSIGKDGKKDKEIPHQTSQMQDYFKVMYPSNQSHLNRELRDLSVTCYSKHKNGRVSCQMISAAMRMRVGSVLQKGTCSQVKDIKQAPLATDSKIEATK